MNEEISKHFEMKLLWENKRFLDIDEKIKDIYIDPKKEMKETKTKVVKVVF